MNRATMTRAMLAVLLLSAEASAAQDVSLGSDSAGDLHLGLVDGGSFHINCPKLASASASEIACTGPHVMVEDGICKPKKPLCEGPEVAVDAAGGCVAAENPLAAALNRVVEQTHNMSQKLYDQLESRMSSVEVSLAAQPALTVAPTPSSCNVRGGTFADFEGAAGTAKCPIIYYDMESTNADGTEVIDLIGDTHLVIQGSPHSGVPGWIGSTYELGACADGFRSSVDYPSQLNGGAAKSISAWAYLTALGGDGDGAMPLVSFGDDSGCSGQTFAINGNNGVGWMAVGCSTDLSTAVVPEKDKWVHIVSTYDGSNWVLYKDGVQIGTRTATLNTGSGSSKIAVGQETWHAGASHFLCAGKVDEVKVYAYALTAAEVLALYQLV